MISFRWEFQSYFHADAINPVVSPEFSYAVITVIKRCHMSTFKKQHGTNGKDTELWVKSHESKS